MSSAFPILLRNAGDDVLEWVLTLCSVSLELVPLPLFLIGEPRVRLIPSPSLSDCVLLHNLAQLPSSSV